MGLSGESYKEAQNTRNKPFLQIVKMKVKREWKQNWNLVINNYLFFNHFGKGTFLVTAGIQKWLWLLTTALGGGGLWVWEYGKYIYL